MKVTQRDRAKALRNTGRIARARTLVCVEGEYVNAVGIAERIGVCQTTAAERLRREQRKPGAVTWGGLAGDR